MDGSVVGCTKCINPNEYLLANTGYCSGNCPTGFAPTPAGTFAQTGDLSWKFTFNKPTTEYLQGDIRITGGYQKGDKFIDDPYPIGHRGLWFDGIYKHLSVSGFAANHSFSLEFFLKSYLSGIATGSLFASYRSPYVNVGGSLYNFKLRKDRPALTEQPSDISLASEATELPRETWAHLAVTVAFNEKSHVKLYMNGEVI